MALFECRKASKKVDFSEIETEILYQGTTATTQNLSVDTNTNETLYIYSITFGSGISNVQGGDILASNNKAVIVKPTSNQVTFSVATSSSGQTIVVCAHIKKVFNSAEAYGNAQNITISNASKDDIYIFGSGSRGTNIDTNNTWLFYEIDNFIFKPVYDNSDNPLNTGFCKAIDDVNGMKLYYGSASYISSSSKFRLYNE